MYDKGCSAYLLFCIFEGAFAWEGRKILRLDENVIFSNYCGRGANMRGWFSYSIGFDRRRSRRGLCVRRNGVANRN